MIYLLFFSGIFNNKLKFINIYVTCVQQCSGWPLCSASWTEHSHELVHVRQIGHEPKTTGRDSCLVVWVKGFHSRETLDAVCIAGQYGTLHSGVFINFIYHWWSFLFLKNIRHLAANVESYKFFNNISYFYCVEARYFYLTSNIEQ